MYDAVHLVFFRNYDYLNVTLDCVLLSMCDGSPVAFIKRAEQTQSKFRVEKTKQIQRSLG